MSVLLLTEADLRRILNEELRRALNDSGAAARGVEWAPQTKAAEIAGVTPQTIRDWLAAGHLGARGRGGRVHLGRLRAFLATPKEEPEPEATSSRAKALAASVMGSLR